MLSGGGRNACPVRFMLMTAKRISPGDYSGEELARILEISGRGVSDCRDRGKTKVSTLKSYANISRNFIM